MGIMKNREYKEQILRESYNEYIENGSDNITLREYVEREAENDPGFFIWLFDDGELDRISKLSDEQREEFKEFLEEL